MKFYERGRLFAEHFLPPLYRQVRLRLEEMIKTNGHAVRLLDVGGRKSPYTIGLPARVTVIDLPRESEIQKDLNLGINSAISDTVKTRRSNVSEIIFGDMTRSGLPDNSFDHVVSVEVIEHVEADELFVSEIARVLKPGGFFLLTTPNGDWVKNTNPDHKRHYKKPQLEALLEKHFANVSVEYAIAGSRFRKMGLKSWSLKHPVQTAESIIGNVVNARQSAAPEIRTRADHTHHLIAVAGN
ncbi:MAG: class I SAM-dependent methyltransferase [Pyrinomonadaceae bacterium]|nr:class I SAM-dependent methyltransferase [Pyrinomonadaceae bacterium]